MPYTNGVGTPTSKCGLPDFLEKLPALFSEWLPRGYPILRVGNFWVTTQMASGRQKMALVTRLPKLPNFLHVYKEKKNARAQSVIFATCCARPKNFPIGDTLFFG